MTCGASLVHQQARFIVIWSTILKSFNLFCRAIILATAVFCHRQVPDEGDYRSHLSHHFVELGMLSDTVRSRRSYEYLKVSRVVSAFFGLLSVLVARQCVHAMHALFLCPSCPYVRNK